MTPSRLTALLSVVLLFVMGVSLHLGVQFYGPVQMWNVLSGAETGTDAIIINTLRIPRTVVGAICGGLLGLAGLLMQAASRNPLAEPGLLGVNAGAALAVVLTLTVLGASGMAAISFAAFAGAVLTALLVFSVAGLASYGMMPVTILLAGVTLAAMFSALVQVLLLIDEAALETLLFWLAGSFAERSLDLAMLGGPVLLGAMIAALGLAPALDAMRADDQSAETLGVQVVRVRIATLALAGLCAGAAVAMAGPVAFLGLIAPHMARRLPGAGRSHRLLAVLAALTGALIAVAADIMARLVVAPAEAPISTVLALIGVPVLIALLRQGKEVAA